MPLFLTQKLSKIALIFESFRTLAAQKLQFFRSPNVSDKVPLAVICGLWLLMVLVEYQPGTWLVGWDNTMPELNFPAALDKTVFAIWQEYRGLGLLDGMAHAANLIHVGVIWLLSLIFPTQLLRYFFVFAMHLLGGMGMYVLLQKKLLKTFYFDTRWLAVVGALFYQFNIGTVQMFYTPLELFIIHFGLLPWLLWALISVLETPTRRNILIFCCLNILALPQAHVPSVFIVYAICMAVFLGFYLFSQKREAWGSRLPQVLRIIVLLFLINAFWGVPYLYSAFKNAPVIIASKINQISNPEVILRNQAYGDFGSVARLHGFSLSYYDLVKEGSNDLMMRSWVDHLSYRGIALIEWLLFGVSLLGLWQIIARRSRAVYPFVALFALSFALLATDTPVISVIPWLFKTVIPFFAEVFRFAFTKFILLFALTYAILLCFGLGWLWLTIRQRYPHTLTPAMKWGLVLGSALFFFVYTQPVWDGHFIYNRVQVRIPGSYFQLFGFFNQEDKNARIAILPSPSFWGWTTNTWGYRGSGFTWYGLRQPTTDRAFDPWSNYNEQFYWQLNRAINTQDSQLFENTLTKYDVQWIVYDESVVDTLAFADIEMSKQRRFIEDISAIAKTKQFGQLHVYKVQKTPSPRAFVSVIRDLPVVSNPFAYTAEDEAFRELGEYRSVTEGSSPQTIYAFPSLFSNRTQDDLEVGFAESNGALEVTSRELPIEDKNWRIEVPNPVTTERYIPVKVYVEPHQTTLEVSLEYAVPQVRIGREVIAAKPVQTVSVSGCLKTNCMMRLGDKYYEIPVLSQKTLLFETLIPTYRQVSLEVFPKGSGKALISAVIDLKAVASLFAYPQREVTGKLVKAQVTVPSMPQLFDVNTPLQQSLDSHTPTRCGFLPNDGWSEKFSSRVDGAEVMTLKAKHGSSCDHMYYGDLPHDNGYVFKLTTRNLSNLPLRVGIQNLNKHRSEIDTRLKATPDFKDNWLIVPPTEEFNSGYTLYMDSISFGRDVSENQVKNVSLWSLPYNTLKQIKLIPVDPAAVAPKTVIRDITVGHRFPWKYEITIPSQATSTTLMLYQGYHDGWVGLSSKAILTHLKANNWQNAWEVPPHTTHVTLLFWPQYLEFAGLVLLLGVGVYIIYLVVKR